MNAVVRRALRRYEDEQAERTRALAALAACTSWQDALTPWERYEHNLEPGDRAEEEWHPDFYDNLDDAWWGMRDSLFEYGYVGEHIPRRARHW